MKHARGRSRDVTIATLLTLLFVGNFGYCDLLGLIHIPYEPLSFGSHKDVVLGTGRATIRLTHASSNADKS
jgi:hypothetical protein